MMKWTQLLPTAICIAITLVSLVGCEESDESGSIVGTWSSGDTELWFYGENEGNKYLQLFRGNTFDSGTYTTSDGHITMISNGGHSKVAITTPFSPITRS